jgi:hypothetical protein
MRLPVSCPGPGLSLTARLWFLATAVSLFLAAVVGVLGGQIEAERAAAERSGLRRDFALALAERCAPALARRDRGTLQQQAGVGRDFVQGRILVLDQLGRVHADSSHMMVGRVVDCLARPGGGVVSRLRLDDPDAGEDAVLLAEVAAPVRLGGETLGEVRVLCEPALRPAAWDLTWFGLSLLTCLSVVVVAVTLTQHWSQRLRRATSAVARLAAGENGGFGTVAAGGELHDFGVALAAMEQGVQEGLLRVADGYRDMALQLVDQLERQGLVPRGRGERCALLAARLSERLRLVAADRRDLVTAARLVDLGKAWIRPDRLRRSRGRQSPAQHAVRGAEQLESLPPLRSCARLLRHHLERFDGGGTPDGLRGDQIPLGSRLLAVLVAYDECRHPEDAKPLSPVQAARRVAEANDGAYDPWLVEQLVAMLGTSEPDRDSERGVWIVPPRGEAQDPAAEDWTDPNEAEIELLPEDRHEPGS